MNCALLTKLTVTVKLESEMRYISFRNATSVPLKAVEVAFSIVMVEFIVKEMNGKRVATFRYAELDEKWRLVYLSVRFTAEKDTASKLVFKPVTSALGKKQAHCVKELLKETTSHMRTLTVWLFVMYSALQ